MPRLVSLSFPKDFDLKRDALLAAISGRAPKSSEEVAAAGQRVDQAFSDAWIRRELKKRAERWKRQANGTVAAPGPQRQPVRSPAAKPGRLTASRRRAERLARAIGHHHGRASLDSTALLRPLGDNVPAARSEEFAFECVVICCLVLAPTIPDWLEGVSDLARCDWGTSHGHVLEYTNRADVCQRWGHEALRLLEESCRSLGWVEDGGQTATVSNRGPGVSDDGIAARIARRHRVAEPLPPMEPPDPAFIETSDLRATSDELWLCLRRFRNDLLAGGSFSAADWFHRLLPIRILAHERGLRPVLGSEEHIVASPDELSRTDPTGEWQSESGEMVQVLIGPGRDGWLETCNLLDGFACSVQRSRAILWAEGWMRARERQLVHAGTVLSDSKSQDGQENTGGAASPPDELEFRPASWFAKGASTWLRKAAGPKRKSKRVRKRVDGETVVYCVEDVRKWRPELIPGD